MANFDELETKRRMHNSIIIAEISEINWEKYEMRVKRGEITTGWLKFPAIISNTYRYYQPIRQGMQVVMTSASGDLNGASVVGVLWKADMPPPALPVGKRPVTELVEFDDGSFIKYDKDTGTLEVLMTKGDIKLKAKNIKIEAEEKLELIAEDIEIKATNIKMTATDIALKSATLTHNGVNIGATHKHIGVMNGKGTTGKPV